MTHRPVVGSGWQEDFYKIFRKDDDEYDYSFEFKKSGGIDIYDAHIDAENDANINNLDKNDIGNINCNTNCGCDYYTV